MLTTDLSVCVPGERALDQRRSTTISKGLLAVLAATLVRARADVVEPGGRAGSSSSSRPWAVAPAVQHRPLLPRARHRTAAARHPAPPPPVSAVSPAPRVFGGVKRHAVGGALPRLSAPPHLPHQARPQRMPASHRRGCTTTTASHTGLRPALIAAFCPVRRPACSLRWRRL